MDSRYTELRRPNPLGSCRERMRLLQRQRQHQQQQQQLNMGPWSPTSNRDQSRVVLARVHVVRDDGRTETVLRRRRIPDRSIDPATEPAETVIVTGTGADTDTDINTVNGVVTGTGTSTNTSTSTSASTSAGTGTGAAPIPGPSTCGAQDLSTRIKEEGSNPRPSPDRQPERTLRHTYSEVGNFCHITECSVCMNKYHHEGGKPKVLNCGHTFCLTCLTTLSHGPTVRCPSCRERIYLPEGVQGLPTNHSLLGLLECCCEDCREHPKFQDCPHCHKTICSKCSPSHLEKYKDETSHIIAGLHDLHNRAQSVVDASDEAQARHHVDRLRQVVKDNFGRIIDALKEEEQKNYERLDLFLENGLDNLEELKETGKEELQRNSNFMEDTQKKMNGESSFDELKQVREMVDVFSGNLRVVLEQVKRPSEMITLQRQEVKTSVHTVVVSNAPKGKGKKRPIPADETAQPTVKKPVDLSVTPPPVNVPNDIDSGPS